MSEDWPSRDNAVAGEYVYHHVKLIDIQNESLPSDARGYAFIGFNCDIGVRRNNGRAGAVQGSKHCRKALSTQAWHLGDTQTIYDLGDIITPDDNLEQAQLELAKIVKIARDHQMIPIVLGGGHEVAFGHYQGLAQAFPDKNIGIINFDAHFDMRPVLDGDLGTSGTPFLQIAKFNQQRSQAFDYLILGIQPYSNTASLIATAKKYHVTYLTAEMLREASQPGVAAVNAFLEKVDLVYLTLDLDVFSTACAPGVSAAQILGLFPHEVMPLFNLICQSGKVIGFDVAELVPKFDVDERTSKLAATFVNHFVHQRSDI